jgi:hypothetical protein
MSVYKVIQKEIDSIKQGLDIHDRSAVDRMDALEWVLALLGDEKDLYIPNLVDLPEVELKPEFSSEIETFYQVGPWSLSTDSDWDVEDAEQTIRSYQSWRRFILTQNEPPVIPQEDGEDA